MKQSAPAQGEPIFFSSLRVCRECDKALSIAEHIEDLCEACNRAFAGIEVPVQGEAAE